MAVSLLNNSALLVIDDGDGTPANFNFTPSSTPRGILVLITSDGSANDRIGAVTYGGVTMQHEAGWTAADTAGEPGRVYGFFLGSSVPTGTQTLSVPHTTGSFKDLVIFAFGGDADLEIGDFGTLANNQANPQVALTPARAAMACCVIYSGHGSASNLTMLTGMTAVHSVAFSFALRFDRQTSVSADPFTIGYTATSDDVAFLAMSVQEVETVTEVDYLADLASEEDEALEGTLSPEPVLAGAQAIEVDAAHDSTLAPEQRLDGDLASEADTAHEGALQTEQVLAGELGTETDVAYPSTFGPDAADGITGLLATEVDTAHESSFGPEPVFASDLAQETDEAHVAALAIEPAFVSDLAREVDEALEGILTRAIVWESDLAIEADEAIDGFIYPTIHHARVLAAAAGAPPPAVISGAPEPADVG